MPGNGEIPQKVLDAKRSDNKKALAAMGAAGGRQAAENMRKWQDLDEFEDKLIHSETIKRDEQANVRISADGDILPIDRPLDPAQVAHLNKDIENINAEISQLKSELAGYKRRERKNT
jgi:hypothetical protein